MLHLANKLHLLWLLLLPALYLWQRFGERRGARHVLFSARRLFPHTGSAVKFFCLRHLFTVKLLALGILILALARPQLLDAIRSEQNKSIDILLTLDLSGSMASMDFEPQNRLEVAKGVISDFINRRQADRLGLVTFAATSFTRCPLTVDYEILKYFLKQAAIGDIEDGTAIGMALANAVNRIRRTPAKTKIIILLTDGVNNRGEIDPRDAAAMARDNNVKVYTIGVGRRGEAPYPITDPFGNRQYMTIKVEIDEPLLQEIANRTGGLYFRATDLPSLQKIFTEIDRWEKVDVKVHSYYEATELFPYLLALGLLLLLTVETLRRTWLRSLP